MTTLSQWFNCGKRLYHDSQYCVMTDFAIKFAIKPAMSARSTRPSRVPFEAKPPVQAFTAHHLTDALLPSNWHTVHILHDKNWYPIAVPMDPVVRAGPAGHV
jgi:hypothetical protein